MKTGEETVAYIDRIISGALSRPGMYAAKPNLLENTLAWLESLRYWIQLPSDIIDGERTDPYSEYCSKKKHGTLQLWTAQPKNKGKGFPEFIDFFKKYLKSEGRL